MENEEQYLEHRQKCFHLPFMLDLVEDRLRIRSLFPLVGFLFYIFIIFLIFKPTFDEEVSATTISVDLDPAAIQHMDKTFSDIRTPHITIKDAYGDVVEDIEAEIVLSDLIVSKTSKKPWCDTTNAKDIAGTLENIRFIEVCRVEMNGTKSSSESDGTITFPNFTITAGVEGIYSLYYQLSLKSKVKSQIIPFFLESQVALVESLNIPPLTADIGQILSTQPQVRVTNTSGLPAVGKKVIVFSWPEPYFDPQSPANSWIYAQKFATLTGEVSQLTDINGEVTFTSLTITGCNYKKVYLHFIVDGSFVSRWGTNEFRRDSLIYDIPRYIPPITLGTTITGVSVTKSNTNILEGELLSTEIQISGSGLTNKVVIAMITGFENIKFAHGYRNKVPGQDLKELEYPMAANYSENFGSPLLNSSYEIIGTDAEGKVNMTNISFSTKGEAGVYYVVYICDGISSSPVEYIVTSRIATVEILNDALPLYYSNDIQKYEITLAVKFVDINGVGVKGKAATSVSFGNSDVTLSLVTTADGYAPSGEDGIYNMYIKIHKISSLLGYSESLISYVVDRVTYSLESTTRLSNSISAYNLFCNHIRLKTPATLTYATTYDTDLVIGFELHNGAIDISTYFVVLNDYNDPVVELVYDPETPSELPSSMLKYDTPAISNKLNNGSFDITFRIKSAPSAMNLYIKMKIGSAETGMASYFCHLIDVPYIVVTPQLSSISVSSGLTSSVNILDPTDTTRDMEVTITATGGGGYTGNAHIDGFIIHLPPSYFALYDATKNLGDLIVNVCDDPQVVTAGKYTKKLKFKNDMKYVGNWGMVLAGGGAVSDPIIFKTTFPFTTLTIDQAAVSATTVESTTIFSTQPTLSSNEGGFVAVAHVVNCDSSTELNAEIDNFGNTANNLTHLDGYITIPQGYKHASAATSSTTTATFIDLHIMETKSGSCLKLQYTIGENEAEMRVESELSAAYNTVGEPYVLEIEDSQSTLNLDSVSLSSLQSYVYSVEVVANEEMATPIHLRILRNTTTEFEENKSFLSIIGAPYSVGGEKITDPQSASPRYLEDYICLFHGKTCVKGGCDNLEIISKKPFVGRTKMPEIKWARPSLGTEFQLIFKTPLSSISGNTGITTAISVEIYPQSLQIIQQPPFQINVGDLFPMVVQATLLNGSPVEKSTVKGNVTQTGFTQGSELMGLSDKYINMMASGEFSLASIAELNMETNVFMEQARSSAISNEQGIARFTMRFIAGRSGIYCLQFQSGKAKSMLSVPFYLTNPLTSVTYQIIEDVEQTVEFEYDLEGKYDPAKLELDNFKVDLKAGGDIYKGEVDVVKLIAVNYYDAKKADDQLKNMNASAAEIQEEMTGDDWNPTTTVLKFFTLLTQGAQVLGELRAQFDLFPVTYLYTRTGGEVEFSKIELLVPEPSKYQLIVEVNGIESERGGVIKVNKEVSLSREAVTTIVEYIFVFLIAITVSFVNMYNARKFLIVVPIVICVVAFVLVEEYNNKGEVYIYANYYCLLLILLNLLWLLGIFVFRRPPTKTYHYSIRERLSLEYTYQRLFKRVSENWLLHIKGEKMMTPEECEMKRNLVFEFFIEQHKDREKNDLSLSYINLGHEEEEQFLSEEPIPSMINKVAPAPISRAENIEGHEESSAPLKPKEEPEFDQEVGWDTSEKKDEDVLFKEVDKKAEISKSLKDGEIKKYLMRTADNKYSALKAGKSYAESNAFKKALIMFTPFCIYDTKKWVGDIFYFPTRFLAAMLIGFISLMYFVYRAVNFIREITEKMGDLKSYLNESIYQFIKSASMMAYASRRDEVSDEELEPFLNIVDDLDDIFAQMIDAIYYAFIIGSLVGIALFILSFFTTLFDFRYNIIECRMGRYEFPKTFGIVTASAFAGNFISNCIVGYVIVLCFFGTTFTPAFMPIVWDIIWLYRETIFWVLLPTLIKVFVQLIAKKTLCTNDSIRFRTYFDVIMFFLAIMSGIATAIARFITMIVIMLFGMVRLDKPIYPSWILNKIWLDFGNMSYYGLVKMHHLHNNPIMLTFHRILLYTLKKSKPERVTIEEKWKAKWDQKVERVNENGGWKDEEEKLAKERFKTRELNELKKWKKRKCIRNRIYLYLTLTRNPGLCKYRTWHLKQAKAEDEEEKEDVEIAFNPVQVMDEKQRVKEEEMKMKEEERLKGISSKSREAISGGTGESKDKESGEGNP